MRIGIDARFLGTGSSGLAKYSESLLLALARHDVDNQYVVFHHENLKRRLKLGPNFRLVPMRGRPMSLAAMVRMALAVRKERLDLLHVHFPLTPPLVTCPILITVHDVLPFARDSGDFGLRFRPSRMLWSYFLYPLALQRAKWIVCVSHATRRALCALFPDVFHKSIVMHSGVNEAFGSPLETITHDMIQARLELPERYLLYSGSARADKNLHTMLQAFALLRQRSPEQQDLHFVLDLSGDEAYVAPLRRLLMQFNLTDRVRILRNINDDERRMVFQSALVLVIISRNEGFGFPVLEAQLCGVPVVAADSGALPEVAGEGALLVDPDNLEGVVSHIERAVNDQTLRAYLADKGRRNVKRFDWDVAAHQLLQIFELLSVSV